MAANNDPIFVKTPNHAEVTFVNADSTNAKDLISAGANGTKVIGIAATSDDTAAVNMRLYIHDGTTAYLVGTVRIAIAAGSDGAAPAVNLLSRAALPWLDSDGQFLLPTGYKLQVAPLAAVTAAKTVTIVCLAADY